MSDAEKGAREWAYLFEAKGVQRYLFESSRLRDAVGASQLIEEIARDPAGIDRGDLLEAAAEAAGVELDQVRCSRRASAAFCLHSHDADALRRLRSAWRVAVMTACPGLEMQDALASGSSWRDARKAAYEQMGSRRFNSAAWLPPRGHPFMAFAQRTGRPAASDRDELLDAMVLAQRARHQDSLRGGESVARRFFGEQPRATEIVCPRNLEPSEQEGKYNPAFPFVGDTRLALVHADISGLGAIYKDAADAKNVTPETLRSLSRAIETAIAGAAAQAAKVFLRDEFIRPFAASGGSRDEACVPPVRPLVLGGDDITVLVRADYALPFAERLLREIPNHSREALRPFPFLGVDHLSACAGVAVFRNGQPFMMAHEVADGLCKFAKGKAKAGRETASFPSALAFHVIASSLQERYEDIRNADMLVRRFGCDTETSETRQYLTANPYWIDGANPSFSALLDLARALDTAKAGRGKLRDLRSLSFSDPAGASALYRRWRRVLGEKNPAALEAVEVALQRFGVTGDDVFFDRDNERHSPLFDALDVLSCGALTVLKQQEKAKQEAPA